MLFTFVELKINKKKTFQKYKHYLHLEKNVPNVIRQLVTYFWLVVLTLLVKGVKVTPTECKFIKLRDRSIWRLKIIETNNSKLYSLNTIFTKLYHVNTTPVWKEHTLTRGVGWGGDRLDRGVSGGDVGLLGSSARHEGSPGRGGGGWSWKK